MAERAVPMRGAMIGRNYLERGSPVTILVRWAGKGPRNVLVRREDGSEVVRPFRGLRRPACQAIEGEGA